MIKETTLDYRDADILAGIIKATLAPACERIEIAELARGVSRRVAKVAIINIVAIPIFRNDLGSQLSLLGDEPRAISSLDLLLKKLFGEEYSTFEPGYKDGDLHKHFYVTFDDDESRIGVHLFVATHEKWISVLEGLA